MSGSTTLLPIAATASVTNPTPCPPPPTCDVTLRQFRHLFPEFADSSVFVDEQVQPWLDLANQSLNPFRWRQYYARGVGLMVAHELALSRMAQLQVQRGGAPGFGIGMVASKAVNGVSVSYNTSIGVIEGGGDLNLTIYGIQLLRLARIVGTGPIQVVGTDASNVSEADLFRGTVGPQNIWI
jgi:hypothetical protein